MLALANGATKKQYVSKLGSPQGSLRNQVQSHHKINFQRIPVKRRDLVKTYVSKLYRLEHTSDASWTQQSPLKPGSERGEKRSRKKTHKGAQQNTCRLACRRQRFQNVSQKVYFFKLFALMGSLGLRLTPERHEGFKM